MSRTYWLSLLLLFAALTGLAALVVIRFRPAAPQVDEPADWFGTVRDSDPLADVCVRFKGTAIATRTDGSGSFRLPRRDGRSRITASREGYFIAGTDADVLPLSLTLKRLPSEDNEDYRWVSSAPGPGRHNCGNCHEEIYREWSLSAHARSATGKHFLNLYDGSDWDGKPNVGWSLLADHEVGKAVCNACHVPTMPFRDPDAPLEADVYSDVRNAKGVAAQGVHCDYCHKIQGVNPEGQLGQAHGRFNLTLLRPSEGQLFFGPLDDVDRGEDSYSSLYRESRYCASCHEGTVFGVPVYTTYSEWQASPAARAGKQCQTCHMAPTGQMTNIAPGHGGIERDAKTLGNHRFFAGGPKEMLRGAVSLECRLSLRERTSFRGAKGDTQADITVRADGAGHRLPTGFIDRHLLLVVEALSADGQSLPLKDGPRLPAVAGRALTGQPGKLYAKLLKDFDGRSPAPFWKADPEPIDTRLIPGEADHLRFTFPESAVRLKVRLLYRRFWQQVADEKHWPDNEIIVTEQEVKVEP